MKRLSILVVLVAVAAATLAQVPPSSIRLQGYLTDRTVNPPVPADGVYAMTFELWDQAMGGAMIGTTSLPSVTVVEGLYDVSLPFAPNLFEEARWLEITVDGEVLMPRLAIESSPYAYLARDAQNVLPDGVDTDAIQDGAVTFDKLALACNPGEVIVRTASGWDCLALTGCLPGTVQSCYDGPGGTAGVGICMSGTQTCQPDGTFGACTGQVLPETEICNGIDDDCNGTADDGAPGSQTYFADVDGDGFGNPGDSIVACAPTGSYTATSGGDCYDFNADARPGQTLFFPVQRGDGSYDYDCNGQQTREFDALYSCSSFTCSSFSSGWVSFVPNCGANAIFGEQCETVFPSSCGPDVEQPRTQRCR